MAKKTVLVSDQSGVEIEEGKGARRFASSLTTPGAVSVSLI